MTTDPYLATRRYKRRFPRVTALWQDAVTRKWIWRCNFCGEDGNPLLAWLHRCPEDRCQCGHVYHNGVCGKATPERHFNALRARCKCDEKPKSGDFQI